MFAEETFGSHLFGNRLLTIGVAASSTGIAVLSGDSEPWWPTGEFTLAAGLVVTLMVIVRASRASGRTDNVPPRVTTRKHLALTHAGSLPAAWGFAAAGTDGATLALSVMPLLFWGFHAHRNGLVRTPVVVPCIVAGFFSALAFWAAASQTAGFANVASGIIVGFGLSSTVVLGVELLGRPGIAKESTGQPSSHATVPTQTGTR